MRWCVSSNAGALENVDSPFTDIAPSSTVARSGSIWYGTIYGLNTTIELTIE